MKSSIPDPAGESSGPETPIDRLDPEDRSVRNKDEQREKAQDKTLADSFPASDPPSSIPDPEDDEEATDSGSASDAA